MQGKCLALGQRGVGRRVAEPRANLRKRRLEALGVHGEAGHLMDVTADRPRDHRGVSVGAGPREGDTDVLHEEERCGGVAQPQPLVQYLRQGGERLVQVTDTRGERGGRAAGDHDEQS